MKIKKKLNLGVGLLFAFIILLCVLGSIFIYQLKRNTDNILVANYQSVQYCLNILNTLETDKKDKFSTIEHYLYFQEKNITESGELAATKALRTHFNNYKNRPFAPEMLAKIRQDLFVIMDLNMKAIERKSELAKSRADAYTSFNSITGALCIVLAFLLLIKLPANIANPIKELTESIKQIADKKYKQRVHFESNSEFGELAQSFNIMAAKIEEYTDTNLAEIMMEKKRVETLINNMHDPVIGLDEQLNILFINEEASHIIGQKQADIIGKSAKELAITNDLLRSLIQDLALPETEVIKPAKPIKIFTHNKEGYFKKEIVHISVTPTGEKQQQLIGHVIILRNITEYKELDFAKTNFIATVSHEFKTPIASIKMSLQLLENNQIGPLNAEQNNLVKSIKEDSNRLLKITGELLNMAQVESGNIQLTLRQTNPADILQPAILATQTLAEQKQINIDVEVPETPLWVMADTDKTVWVITNLLTNAIRYSYDNSRIKIKIAAENNEVLISVSDTGQGIAPQYLQKIFDRYFKIPGTKKEGTGLGLAISKEFMEAQHGKITVESELGKGSTFTLGLPAAKA